MDGNHWQKLKQKVCNDSTIRDLQQKPNTTKFGSVFNLNMLLAILEGNYFHKSQKWWPFMLLKGETCNQEPKMGSEHP